jgi:hypothetical protein
MLGRRTDRLWEVDLSPSCSCSLHPSSSSAVAITLYEQFALMSFDWAVITGKRRRRAIHIAYFGSKIAWWCYMVLIMIRYYTVNRVDCTANMVAVQVLMGVVNTCASIVSSYRRQQEGHCLLTLTLTLTPTAIISSAPGMSSSLRLPWQDTYLHYLRSRRRHLGTHCCLGRRYPRCGHGVVRATALPMGLGQL